MALVDADAIRAFLTMLGTRQAEPAQLLLLGGGALLLLGSQRSTIDIDYVGDDLQLSEFQRTIAEVANELHIHVDPVPIERFVPLPPETETRRVFISRFGAMDVFVIDPYVIALSKVDRGLDTDIADVVFLLERGLVDFDRLADLVVASLRQAAEYDMDPAATRRHLAVIRRRIGQP